MGDQMADENAAEVMEESAPSPEQSAEETQVEAPAEEETEDSGESTEERKNTVQKRIDRLTRARREAEREAQQSTQQADELKKRNEELMKRLEALETRAKSEDVLRKKPVRDHFYSDEEYIEALADWKYEQRTAQSPKEPPKEDPKKDESKPAQPDPAFQEVFRNVIEEGRSAHDDFEQTVLSESVPITQPMAEVALDSENAAEILYFFGKNPQKAYEIAQMSPLRMARAIAEIEQGVTQPKSSNPSNAPDPIEPVRAKKGGGKADPTKMSTEEWMKWRERQLQQK